MVIACITYFVLPYMLLTTVEVHLPYIRKEVIGYPAPIHDQWWGYLTESVKWFSMDDDNEDEKIYHLLNNYFRSLHPAAMMTLSNSIKKMMMIGVLSMYHKDLVLVVILMSNIDLSKLIPRVSGSLTVHEIYRPTVFLPALWTATSLGRQFYLFRGNRIFPWLATNDWFSSRLCDNDHLPDYHLLFLLQKLSLLFWGYTTTVNLIWTLF